MSTRRDRTRPGVYFLASVFGRGGYADENLGLVLSLADKGLPICLHPPSVFFDVDEILDPETRESLYKLKRQGVDPVRSVLFQSGQANAFRVRKSIFKFNVGRTMFETEGLPTSWKDRLLQLDEIWVPSEFNRRTFVCAGVPGSRLRVLPEGIDASLFRPSTERLLLSKCDRQFTFLSICKWEDRKGLDVLLKAFVSEFTAYDDVALVLKMFTFYDHQDLRSRFTRYVTHTLNIDLNVAPPIVVLDETPLPRSCMPRLYNSADAFVLPSRGEGWGRTYMEALACELPVIASRWGGQLDFLHDSNSYLVPCEVVDVPSSVDVSYFAGHRWAEPNINKLAQLMRHLYSHPQEARERARVGRQEIVERWDWCHVSKIWLAEFSRLLDY